LGLIDGKAALIDPAGCTYAGQCEAVCPTGAIALPYQIVIEPGTDR
jgi:ferredoxin